MPRLRRSDKRKHEVTLELLNVLANMRAYPDRDAAASMWEQFWGGPDEGRAAFDDLRHHGHPTLGSTLGVQDGDDYATWLDRITAS